jgi:hypothetical protein
MAHNGAGHDDLPATWPFRAGATLLVVGFCWFCAGFAIRDFGKNAELKAHMPVFWGLVITALVLFACGTIYNVAKERRRKQPG